MAEAATGPRVERLPLICCVEGQADVAGLRLWGLRLTGCQGLKSAGVLRQLSVQGYLSSAR